MQAISWWCRYPGSDKTVSDLLEWKREIDQLAMRSMTLEFAELVLDLYREWLKFAYVATVYFGDESLPLIRQGVALMVLERSIVIRYEKTHRTQRLWSSLLEIGSRDGFGETDPLLFLQR